VETSSTFRKAPSPAVVGVWGVWVGFGMLLGPEGTGPVPFVGAGFVVSVPGANPCAHTGSGLVFSCVLACFCSWVFPGVGGGLGWLVSLVRLVGRVWGLWVGGCL
jgi:hypothetical protein